MKEDTRHSTPNIYSNRTDWPTTSSTLVRSIAVQLRRGSGGEPTMTDRSRWRGDGGSGCTNDDCTASDRWTRVLSTEEITHVYDTPGERDALPFDFPLPDDATHACTACGWLYFGKHGASFDTERTEVAPLPFGFEANAEDPPIENLERLVAGAPEGATMDQIVAVAERTIPGCGRTMVERFVEAADRSDLRVAPAEDYM